MKDFFKRLPNRLASLGVLIFVLLLVLLNFCSSCELLPRWKEDKLRRYTVERGEHYYKPVLPYLDNGELNFKFKLDTSSLYNFSDYYGLQFLNKITGLSDCNKAHTNTGVYLAWRPEHDQDGNNTGNFEIFAYWRIDGNKNFFKLDVIEPNEVVKCRLRVLKNWFTWELGKAVEFRTDKPSGCKGLFKVMYRIQPYFGGKPTAKKRMFLFLTFV